MIAQNSIDEVYEKADLVETIGKYVTLKQKGGSYHGCCPFHDEKTPSFVVTPAKSVYKCFGCGKSGKDAVKFIMEKEHLSWIDSIRKLSGVFNVTLQETEDDQDKKEQLIKRGDLVKINQAVKDKYVSTIDHERYAELFNMPGTTDMPGAVFGELFRRKISPELLSLFEIGFAPDEWKFITPGLIDKGLYEPAIELGLIKTKDGNSYDIYRGRIIFPIHNERGEVIGFGGRKLEDGKPDNPKYINSSDSALYKKDSVLYGIYQAADAIRKEKFAVLVEGYYDVTGFHQAGVQNTVCSCGTAFTDGHAKILKKYTNHVVMMGDGDAAGMKANLKAVDILLRHDFKVEICPLPDGHDPDSFAREFENVEEQVND